MAEFCKECFIEVCGADLKKEKIITSKDLDFCENCGEWKPVVVKVVYKNPIRRFIHNHRYLSRSPRRRKRG